MDEIRPILAVDLPYLDQRTELRYRVDSAPDDVPLNRRQPSITNFLMVGLKMCTNKHVETRLSGGNRAVKEV